MTHLDESMAYEMVSEWLPDFIAYAENPWHVDASNLLDRARMRVWEDYDAQLESDADADERAANTVSAETTFQVLMGVAEWLVLQREAS